MNSSLFLKLVRKSVSLVLVAVFITTPAFAQVQNINYNYSQEKQENFDRFEIDFVPFKSLDTMEYTIDRILYNRSNNILSVLDKGYDIGDYEISKLFENLREFPAPRSFFGKLAVAFVITATVRITITIIDQVVVNITGSSIETHVRNAVDRAFVYFRSGFRGTHTSHAIYAGGGNWMLP